ncbi:MAG: T9SS type A sorting domain-containing protein [Bacteroidetes bacterium]|nr:T9SS type A sorting domain-containing protein [Bacteroidota bacterium]
MNKARLMAIAIVAIVMSTAFGILSENGKAGYTGSPSELNCDDCHNSFGNSNSGTGSIYVTSTMNNWQYVPGQTYTVNVIVKQSGRPLFGVGFEALTSTNANAGSLVITNSAKTQIKTKTVSGVTRNNVVHQMNGGMHADSAIFTFNWVAPSTNIGNITFYFAGIAANNNGSENNDYAYHSSKVVTPASATGILEQSNSISEFKSYINSEGRIAIEFQSTTADQPRVNLYDMEGRMISSQLLDSYSIGEVKSSVSIPSELKSGNYIVSILSNNHKLSSKIFIP